MIWRLEGKAAAERALSYVVPVGEEAQYVGRALDVAKSFVESGNRHLGGL